MGAAEALASQGTIAMNDMHTHSIERYSLDAPLNAREKGVPGNVNGLPLEEIGARQWNLFAEDIPLPAAVIISSALRHNSQWMRTFADSRNARLAPHGKTTLCPTLFDLQLHDGAWGLTVATPHQVQVARSFGYSRVILANQLVGKSAIEWILEELDRFPAFDFYCLVDSAENLEQITRIARRKQLNRPLQVLIEMGFKGGRTGCRSVDAAVALASLIAANRDVIALRGVEGYEGVIHAPTDEATLLQVDAFLDTVIECAHRCAREDLFAVGEVLLSAGGSAFFDRVSEKLGNVDLKRPSLVLLRGGCYLIHDHSLFACSFEKIKARSPGAAGLKPGLIPALEVWAYVQSLPEPGRAIATLGKRDVSYDDLPKAIKWYRPGTGVSEALPITGDYRVSHLNDQHCYVDIPPDCPWRVGDMVGFGVSHPCLTFDKWRVLHVVDDAYRITGSVRTYF
jgi:D-serine dehydratase